MLIGFPTKLRFGFRDVVSVTDVAWAYSIVNQI